MEIRPMLSRREFRAALRASLSPRYILAASMVLLASAGVHAQGLKNAQPTLKVGNWTVLRSVDTMTDKISCTGIYKSNYGVQLTPDTLFVKVVGGVESVTLRFGDEPARRMRMPSKIEKKSGRSPLTGMNSLKHCGQTDFACNLLRSSEALLRKI
jgi:hypothetical protein